MNPAPPLSARPDIGTTITISSTRRDKDSDGVVLAHDEVGIRIRCVDEVGEMAVERFYPWGQVAFTQWAARVEVTELAMAADMTSDEAAAALEEVVTALAADMTSDEGVEAAIAAEAQTTGADLAVDVAAGLLPPSKLRERLDAWRGQPGEECWSEDFAERLRDEGFPVEAFIAREAETRDIVPAETSWDSDGSGFGGPAGSASFAASINDDRQPGDPFLKPVGRMLIRPEQTGYRLPMPILELSPNVDLAIWAAVNHSPAELQTIYSLHEGDFHSYMDRLRRGDPTSNGYDNVLGES